MIHKTAIVEGNVSIGDNVKIGPYSYISGHVVIEDNTEIGHNVQIEGHTRIGKNNKIYHSAYIGGHPQDVSFSEGKSFVDIGDDNIIREFVQIHRGSEEGTATRVGSNCYLMGTVHLAHNVKVGDNVVIANCSLLAGFVEIDDFTFISGFCGFHQFVKVGKYTMIGGHSRINKDCPPFMIVVGNPPKVAGINVVGLRRNNFSQERRTRIKNIYKLLFRLGKNVSQAVEELESMEINEDILELINFIKSSERGIIK